MYCIMCTTTDKTRFLSKIYESYEEALREADELQKFSKKYWDDLVSYKIIKIEITEIKEEVALK